MGVYNMPLSNLGIMAASNVVDVDTKLNSLRAIFFPSESLSNENLKLLLYRPWDSNNPSYDAEWNGKLPGIVKKIEDEAEKKSQHPPRARLPASILFIIQTQTELAPSKYNVVNNDVSARCFGMRHKDSPAGVDPLNDKIPPEDQTWQMRQTASRSCFSGPTPPGTSLPTGLSPATDNGRWNYVDRKENVVPGGAKKPSATACDIRRKDQCYSVKTGIVFVGKDNQGASKVKNLGNKATLEPDTVVATLRTEFLLAMDRYYETRGALTATCLKSTLVEDSIPVEVKNDGFQFRDLSRLDPAMRYFPALSMPYVKGNGNLTTWQPQQELSGNDFQAWKTYWSTKYAARIGETKALLHLLYGFAPLTSNMQNFVLEVDPKDPKTLKRAVLLDVLDFRLHTSWVRLALSAEGGQEKALQTSLCDVNSPLNLDPSLPDRIKNFSQTGAYAPLDPNHIIKVQQTQNNTTVEVEQIKEAKPSEVL
ncbi:uncharacterized protein Z519_10313 [Cladophialophora bantiana CBS 173.52]|uniref:Uncharacterized protein n=1 Tax=Cladophialophora bantiana (strain ATCC 10958 / CBS 173.52 / CDC B-1940 / NIH 8579) TaxID=1442370 RepID=A0A0D2HW75_CLAB1|nr:uncharacterized protein Z519_10313 [Cladophialophora bantiana CBS 173.52]KIW88829.1 hypothetical protein Z519_10313 [Cladophialophora bantiana CBS 173.52]